MDSLQILNVDQYTVVQLKKLFNECGSNVNFSMNSQCKMLKMVKNDYFLS